MADNDGRAGDPESCQAGSTVGGRAPVARYGLGPDPGVTSRNMPSHPGAAILITNMTHSSRGLKFLCFSNFYATNFNLKFTNLNTSDSHQSPDHQT